MSVIKIASVIKNTFKKIYENNSVSQHRFLTKHRNSPAKLIFDYRDKIYDENRSYYFLYLCLSVSFSVMDFCQLGINDMVEN